MGDIYLFKMLILLIKMHIYVLNQKSKDYDLILRLIAIFSSRFTAQLLKTT